MHQVPHHYHPPFEKVSYKQDIHFQKYFFTGPLKLGLGSHEDNKATYNLKDIELIISKDSLFTLDKEVRLCEEESKADCSTRQYMDALMEECQCLPFQLRSLLTNVCIQN